MSKDARVNPFLDFFSKMGVKFVDEAGDNLIDEKLTLCHGCQSMTRTLKIDNTCLKCGAKKEDE